MKKRARQLWRTLIPALAMAALPMVASAANPLYPPGIGFNASVDYTKPNFAQSPNIRKFVDSLPGLGAANKNNLGQYIPVAIPDTTTFPGADYYELGLKQYTQKMSTDLPATTLRGYYQKNTTDPTVLNILQYLGPAIVAQRNRPVRIKWHNELATGVAGNLFLPVDTTIMGAGMGPTTGVNFTQNRAVIHLHGGRTPWISDGTPHQWITPAGDSTPYKNGVSFVNVPDMVNGSTVNGVAVPCVGGATCYTPAAGDGIGTLFYSNEQSSRLLFYHDHAWGITRLNVYAGLAAPYLITSQAEEDLITGTNVSGANPAGKQILPDLGGVYHLGIPLVIQDKSFVNDATTPPGAGFPAATSGYVPTSPTLTTDPLWAFYVVPAMGGGSLWTPHEYMPIENIFDPTGNTPNGRWDYAPFMNPPMVPQNLTLPSPTIVPEAFQDTAVVNGTAFPYLVLPPQAVRFRILSVGNDRTFNLSWFKADPLRVNVTNGGTNYTAPTVTITGNAGTYTSATATVSPGTITSIDSVGCTHFIQPPTVTLTGGGGTCTSVFANIPSNTSGALDFTALGCTGFTSAPTVTISGGGGGTCTSITASIIPKGVITGITVTGAKGYRSDQAVPTVAITDSTGTGAAATAFVNTEVAMVPASPNPSYPTWASDGRDGGVPDPTMSGPPWYQIGNESGFLANVAVWPPMPIAYEQNRQNIPTLGVTYHSLLLMPAHRADVVVDFSQYKDGDVLILYNDGPAPMPGFWPINDYYTDDPDQTGVGAAPSTPPGFGPNTRTVMQVRITGTSTSSFKFDPAALQAALPKAFAVDQDKPLVPQMAYNAAFPGFATYDVYAQNYYDTLNIAGTAQPISRIKAVAPGNGYPSAPTVNIVGGGQVTQATAKAGLQPCGGLTLLTAGAGYTTPPTVTIGTPASTYTAGLAGNPVIPAGATQVTATALATVTGGAVTALTIDEPGSWYNTNPLDLLAVPTCTVSPPTGCTINTTTCVAATCSTFIAVGGTMGSITLTAPGSYTGQPYVYITGGAPGTGATAVALLNGALIFTGKNITEGFDPDYGRMDIRLGSTPNPLSPNVGNGQVVGVARYIDPPTEMLNDGQVILWRITHLGVDSHSLHFHLFDLQVVNHVDFTNVVKPPYPDEIGWREVIRTNPMEDIIVALRPKAMSLPFPVPRSNRVLDPSNAAGVNTNFLPIAPPAGIAAVPQVTNTPTDFGWEYVWHCHLLGHEENDMMRPMCFQPPTAVPAAPGLATTGVVASAGQVALTWTSTTNATFTNTPAGFNIQRCSGSTTCTPATIATVNNASQLTYTDSTVASATAYRYRIQAYNNAGTANSTTRNVTASTFTAVTASITSPATGTVFSTPATIPLTATATGGTISSVAFYNGATLLGTVTTSPYTFNWTGVAVGTYTVTAKATNSTGASAVSAPITVIVQTATTPPATAPTIVSPSGAGIATTTTFNVNAMAGVTGYVIWLQNNTTNTGAPISFTAAQGGTSCAAGTGVCAFTPPAGSLVAGDGYAWAAAATNAVGQGPWSTSLLFSIPLPAPTIVSPSGPGIATTATFNVNAVPGATGYVIWLQNNTTNTGAPISFTAAQGGTTCAAGTGVCTFTLAAGSLVSTNNYAWAAAATNAVGQGPWSTPLLFSAL